MRDLHQSPQGDRYEKIIMMHSGRPGIHPAVRMVPALCWQARATLLLVLLQATELLLSADALPRSKRETNVFEFSSMLKSLFDTLAKSGTARDALAARRAAEACLNDDGSLAAPRAQRLQPARQGSNGADEAAVFWLGLISHVLPVLRENAEELAEVIALGVRSLLQILACNARVEPQGGMALAASLLAALARLLSPLACDQIASLLQGELGAADEGAMAASGSCSGGGDSPGGLRFLAYLAGGAASAKAAGASEASGHRTACVARIFSTLASEPDEHDHPAWWAPVSAFVTMHSPLAVTIRCRGPEEEWAQEQGSITSSSCQPLGECDKIALEVMGGRLSCLCPGVHVEKQDRSAGRMRVLDTSNSDSLWVAAADGILQHVNVQSVLLRSSYEGQLGPRSLRELLLPLILGLKEADLNELFQADCGQATGGRIYVQLALLKVGSFRVWGLGLGFQSYFNLNIHC